MDDLPTPPQQDSTDEQKKREQRQRQMRTYIGYAISALVVFLLFQRFFLEPSAQQTSKITYSTFKQSLAAGQIVTVVIGNSQLTGTMRNPESITTTNGVDHGATSRMTDPVTVAAPVTDTVPFNTIFTAGEDPKLVEDLQTAGVEFSFRSAANPFWGIALVYVLPILLIGGFWLVISRQMSKGGGRRRFGGHI